MISVKKMENGTYEVSVNAGTATRHVVTVSDDYYKKLTGGAVSPERLIEASFEFLLEREPNTSILSQFDLPVISRYFGEYEGEISRRLGAG